MKTRKLTLLALLTAIALTIFMVEAQIPAIVPIPGIKLVPVLLPALWLLEWLRVGWAAALVALVCGALLSLLALAKWRMPLHFDIGDKGRYQI